MVPEGESRIDSTNGAFTGVEWALKLRLFHNDDGVSFVLKGDSVRWSQFYGADYGRGSGWAGLFVRVYGCPVHFGEPERGVGSGLRQWPNLLRVPWRHPSIWVRGGSVLSLILLNNSSSCSLNLVVVVLITRGWKLTAWRAIRWRW